ncbi:MAG: Uma2 family endonuclease [Nitrospinae bacterium]|nr:Uma2 family endonuclease [Nitrospinota bacterium]MBI5749759.1 Uma2 family endonuclease [Nitrospinota bacterium]
MPIVLKKDAKYTYSDYLTWPNDEQWEIIDGRAYNMSPAPKIRHQNVVSNFHIALKTFPDNNCYTGIAPTDVVFDDYNVVQPDVFIVCDKSKILETHIRGAPELIIEVTSPANEVKDRREKKSLYERFGVIEYVIVFVEEEYLERYILKDNKYTGPEIYNRDETLKLVTLPIEINIMAIFKGV